MKTLDYWVSVALPPALAAGMDPPRAVDHAIDIAPLVIDRLCERDGHDYDVPTSVGKCTRCGHLKNGTGHL